MSTDRLGQRVNTVDLRSLKVAYDVRAALPKLTERSKRWTRANICPVCSGPKDVQAKRCRKCQRRQIGYARADRPALVYTHEESAGLMGAGSNRTLGERRTGHTRPGPNIARKVLVDGQWVVAEDEDE